MSKNIKMDNVSSFVLYCTLLFKSWNDLNKLLCVSVRLQAELRQLPEALLNNCPITDIHTNGQSILFKPKTWKHTHGHMHNSNTLSLIYKPAVLRSRNSSLWIDNLFTDLILLICTFLAFIGCVCKLIFPVASLLDIPTNTEIFEVPSLIFLSTTHVF